MRTALLTAAVAAAALALGLALALGGYAAGWCLGQALALPWEICAGAGLFGGLVLGLLIVCAALPRIEDWIDHR